MPRAAELVDGHIYYSVQYVREDQMSLMEGGRIGVRAPVIITTLLYTGTQDEEGSYVFLPLPLDLPGLKQALGYAS